MSVAGPAPTSVSNDEDGVGGDGLRRRVVRAALASAAAALAVLVLGLVLELQEPAQSARARVTTTAEAPPAGATPPPLVSHVILSARGTATSPVVWEVRPGNDRERNAVLAGYQVYVGTVVRLAEAPDPDDAALPQVALDPQLALLRRALASGAAAGTSRRGKVVAVARVVALRGRLATVIGCLDTAGQRAYGPAGQPARRRSPVVSVFTVGMRRDDGRWKIYSQAPLPPARCRR